MRILIDVKHPAHVHFFRNFIKIMEKKGHKILVTARDKEMTIELLKKYKIKYIKLTSMGRGKTALARELPVRLYRFYKVAKKFKPDILLGLMGIIIAPVGRLLGIPSLVFYDTENARLTNSIAYAFCTKFITPTCYKKKLGEKNVRYRGYHELTYLHPNYFKPDPKVLKEAGLREGETFSIVRFVSWGASHDFGQKGITAQNKVKAVRELVKYGKVLVVSEGELPKELEVYRNKVEPSKIHDLMYYATLLYGESATMASEAAVLGTNAIYLDNDGRGYTDEEENDFELVYNFSGSEGDQIKSIEKAVELISDKTSKKKARAKRKKLLKDKIDVTQFVVNQVSNFLNK